MAGKKTKRLNDCMNRINHGARSENLTVFFNKEECQLMMIYWSQLQDRLASIRYWESVIWLQPVVWFFIGFWARALFNYIFTRS
jgi:hypothetical protein